MDEKHVEYAQAFGMVGLCAVGAYLNINGESSPFCYIGAFFLFLGVVD